MHRTQHGLPMNVDEVLRQLEADETREKEALRKFYARNAAPHYSKVRVNWWGLFIAGAIAALVIWKAITIVIDAGLRAFGQ